MHGWRSYIDGEPVDLVMIRRLADFAFDNRPVSVLIEPSTKNDFFDILISRVVEKKKQYLDGGFKNIEGLSALKQLNQRDIILVANENTKPDVLIQVEEIIYNYANDLECTVQMDSFIPVVEFSNMRSGEMELNSVLFPLRSCEENVRNCLKIALSEFMKQRNVKAVDMDTLRRERDLLMTSSSFNVLDEAPLDTEWQTVFDMILKK